MPLLNRVAVLWKRGDNGEHLNGSPICHIDEMDWGLPLETIISQHCSKAFLPVIIDRKLLPFIIAGYFPIYEKGVIIDPFTTAKPLFLKSIKMDYATLENSLGIAGLKDRVATEDSLGILDGTRLTSLDFTAMKAEEPVKDVMSISNGSYTIGVAMNYATWALFDADVTNLTGNLTGTQQTATTETTSCDIAVALGGKTLTLTSALNPLGNFNAGYLISANINDATPIRVGCTAASASIINISNLNLKRTGTPTLNYFNLQAYTGANITNNVNNCLIDNNSKKCGGFGISGTGTILKAFNCIVANSDKTATGTGSSFGFYVHSSADNTGSIIENCTLYNVKVGFYNVPNLAITANNIASFGNTTDYGYGTTPTAGLGNTVASKCASSDTSGSEAGLRSLVAASQFLSTTITDSTFLKLKRSGVLGNQGTVHSIAANTADITGHAYAQRYIGAFGLPNWRKETR